MTITTLEKFFSPRSVAVVGASDTPARVGYAVIRNLVSGGFQGRIYPVNPARKKVNGIKAYPNLTDIGEAIDLAVIATPIETVRTVIKDCAKAAVDCAIVLSAGGKETGAAGEQIEREILEAARQARLRMIGPNCVGIISTAASLNTSFLDCMPPAGHIAFISQSGAMCLAILDRAARERIGFRHFVSIGSMLDVDFGDVLNHCGGDHRRARHRAVCRKHHPCPQIHERRPCGFPHQTHYRAQSRPFAGRRGRRVFPHRCPGRRGRRLSGRFCPGRHYPGGNNRRTLRLHRTDGQTTATGRPSPGRHYQWRRPGSDGHGCHRTRGFTTGPSFSGNDDPARCGPACLLEPRQPHRHYR